MSDYLAWLDAHVNLETGVGSAPGGSRPPERALAQFQQLCTMLGSPQTSFPAILVGGTVGKTSTTMLASGLLHSFGLSTGTYTSPHLIRPNERIRWNGGPIPDFDFDEQLRAIANVEPFLDERPSWFEVMTAAAFQYFSEVAANVAVVEVGLGGAWDATTLVDAHVVTLTNIGIDHTEYFGDTYQDIADAEAGIIQPQATVVCGETDTELVERMRTRPHREWWQFGSEFDLVADEVAVGGRLVHIVTPEGDYPDLFLSLHGVHQGRNAAVALASIEAFLGRPLERELVEEVFGTARVAGRMEVAGHHPLVVLDGAHNLPGALALGEALGDAFPSARRRWVVGLLREKDPREMLEALGVEADDAVYATAPPSPRAHDAAVVAEAARALGVEDLMTVENPVVATQRAIADADPEDLVIVTGSLYLLGPVRGALVSGAV